MKEKVSRSQEIYDELLKEGIIITGDESRELRSQGFKTALIAFEKESSFFNEI